MGHQSLFSLLLESELSEVHDSCRFFGYKVVVDLLFFSLFELSFVSNVVMQMLLCRGVFVRSETLQNVWSVECRKLKFEEGGEFHLSY